MACEARLQHIPVKSVVLFIFRDLPQFIPGHCGLELVAPGTARPAGGFIDQWRLVRQFEDRTEVLPVVEVARHGVADLLGDRKEFRISALPPNRQQTTHDDSVVKEI